MLRKSGIFSEFEIQSGLTPERACKVSRLVSIRAEISQKKKDVGLEEGVDSQPDRVQTSPDHTTLDDDAHVEGVSEDLSLMTEQTAIPHSEHGEMQDE